MGVPYHTEDTRANHNRPYITYISHPRYILQIFYTLPKKPESSARACFAPCACGSLLPPHLPPYALQAQGIEQSSCSQFSLYSELLSTIAVLWTSVLLTLPTRMCAIFSAQTSPILGVLATHVAHSYIIYSHITYSHYVFLLLRTLYIIPYRPYIYINYQDGKFQDSERGDL